MIKKIRKFLCTTHPGSLALGAVILGVLVWEFIVVGWELVLVFALGAGIFAGFGVIGFGLYKLIAWAQSYCKESEDE
jgi:hypothetical protein